MRTVYTTENIRIDGVEVLPITRLGEYKRRWVLTTRKRLLAHPTAPERETALLLALFDDPPVRQAYFQIRGRSYFLDFFFRERMLAVEVDGSSHQARKEHDRRRDADFRSIGIRTIRIKNKDVMDGHLIERLSARIFR